MLLHRHRHLIYMPLDRPLDTSTLCWWFAASPLKPSLCPQACLRWHPDKIRPRLIARLNSFKLHHATQPGSNSTACVDEASQYAQVSAARPAAAAETGCSGSLLHKQPMAKCAYGQKHIPEPSTITGRAVDTIVQRAAMLFQIAKKEHEDASWTPSGCW
jgi:hypothetical protein